ncbi:PepSY-associated TM helix domain-containing protein [Solimonas flava]|uniref:PepSY-associated TM helix domain-containing protein n=1 Tax=Solimonas flava TaxID=415849 RepID=UPI00040748F6|nr:PepSY-associated TM helix domain-containing protein [Solimonas flava]
MVKLPQSETKKLLAIHGWSGVLLGLLLYAVICTGVAAVFEDEIKDWSSALPTRAAAEFPAGLDAAMRRVAAETDPHFLHDLSIWPAGGGRLNLLFHTHETDAKGRPVERGVEYELDGNTMQTVARREGRLDDLGSARRSSALADFLVELHVRLHLPNPYGLFLTGVLGLVMMIAAVTGFLIHRHLIKELFTLRRRRDRLLTARDAHVVAGTWNLPFAFILAFTGSFFSFASAFALPAMAMVAFGGDRDRMFETLIGRTVAEDSRAAAPADLDAVLRDVRQRAGEEPTFISIEHYGRVDAAITLFMEPKRGELTPISYVYSGASGAFLQDKPLLGLQPSFGGQLYALIGPLHFGNFAGPLSKAVWFALGFAGAYVTLTGLLLWTQRRAGQPAWRRMGIVVHWVGYGLPLALLACPYGYFIAVASGADAITAQAIAFLGVAALTFAAVLLLRRHDAIQRAALLASGAAMLGMPLLRLVCGGLGWSSALRAGIVVVPAVDLALLSAALICLLLAARSIRSARALPVREVRAAGWAPGA